VTTDQNGTQVVGSIKYFPFVKCKKKAPVNRGLSAVITDEYIVQEVAAIIFF